ncbi:hypothetical protein [Aeromonas cavernicola]|uniref:Uncharacterized protein n=1 Tax=Aeromonas cavernicola TaxID=1006623 RepID=A0A2H9U3E8_9GAMM|nr:hypothetical protein [Aeromonas cavernicola]PJG58545.1 hypothetical protein CUC53_12245 [Aeromonas cavernicola]
MLGFVLGDMYGRWPLLTPPPRLGKHFPLPAGYQCYGRVSAAMMTIDTLLATPYPQKLYRDLVYGHVVERQRRLFAEHIVLARPAQGEELERSIERSFISTAVPVGLLAMSEEIALLTAPRPKKSHPQWAALCKVIDCTVMLLFYAKVIRQRNAVLANISHQFGYQPEVSLRARVASATEGDHEAFIINIMTGIAHADSFKESLENGIKMGMRDPAFFCIVGAIASTLWGVPKVWAYQVSQFIQREHDLYLQLLSRCETRAGRRQINLVPPKPPFFAPVRQQVARLFNSA